MNDDFLHKYRQPPRKAFARALYQKLEADKVSRWPERRTLAALVASLLLVVTVALSGVRQPQLATLAQIDARSPLDGLQAITAENAAQLEVVARLGSGIFTEVVWAGDTIAAAGARGAWVYPADLSAPPRLFANTSPTIWKTGITLSPDGETLAIADGSSIRLWDVATAVPIKTLSHPGPILALAFSPDGRWLASGNGDGEADNAVFIWDWAEGQTVLRDLTHKNPVTDLAFSPDGAMLASLDSAEIHLFNLNTAVVDHVLDGMRFNPNGGLAFSPDGKTLAAATDHTIALWSVDTGELLDNATFDIYNSNAALISRASITSFTYLPDGQLAVGMEGRGVELWDVERDLARATTSTLDNTRQHVSSIAPSPNGDQIVVLRENNAIELRDTDTLSLAAERRDGTDRVLYVTLLDDDQSVTVAGAGGQMHTYNLNTGQKVREIAGERYYTGDFVMAQHENQVAYLQQGGGIALADAASGEVQRVLPYSDALLIDQLEFSPDGALLAASDVTSNQVLLWDLSSPDTPQVVLETDTQLEGTIAFSPDSRLIGAVTGMNGSVITVVELAAQTEYTLDSAGNRILEIAFSPDGQSVAAITNATVVQVMDVETGEVIHTLSHRGDAIMTEVAFSPDGSILATAAGESLYLWDAEAGTLLARIQEANANRLRFSSDGRYLVTGGWDGFVRVWGVPEN